MSGEYFMKKYTAKGQKKKENEQKAHISKVLRPVWGDAQKPALPHRCVMLDLISQPFSGHLHSISLVFILFIRGALEH